MHIYEVRPRKDHRGVDLISAVLPFSRLLYGGANAISNAIGYAMHRSRSHDAVIRVYDEAGNVSETHERKGANSSHNLWRHTRILRCLLSSPKSQRHRRNRL